MTETTVADGKYTIRHGQGGHVHVLRHGESWRDATGDKFTLSCAQEIEALRAEVVALKRDALRLDWLQRRAQTSYTGVSFDHRKTLEGEPGGYRFMSHHYLGERHPSIRGAIDSELAT